MKKSKIIMTILSVIAAPLITIFNQDIKTFLIDLNWEYYIFFISIVLFIMTVTGVYVRLFVLKDTNKKYKSLEKKWNKVQETNEMLVENTLNTTRINKALYKEGFINHYIKTAKNKEELEIYARYLVSFYNEYGITFDDWSKYKLPKKLLTSMNKVLHEDEAKKYDNESKNNNS